MTVSTFDLFKIGIGPSSSHTVGPMVAARRFGEMLEAAGQLAITARVSVDLYGSLALTGKGHATDVAVILGLAGQVPATVDPDAVPGIVEAVSASGRVPLLGTHDVAFAPATDMRFLQRERQPYHSNAMALGAWDAQGELLLRRLYYSVGGGFVLDEDEAIRNAPALDLPPIPFPFTSGADLMAIGETTGLTIAQIMLANELALRAPSEVDAGLDELADTMAACIDRGCAQTGTLPGGLKVRRRAASLSKELADRQQQSLSEPLAVLDWINVWAMAVNEENAAGGRVVTAPTNGAAGIIPAVLRYYERCYRGDKAGRRTFLLTAAAIGALYKRNASISGAEVGCQGEVGVACSMAAAGLTAALGGNNAQIENAAEIGMEHNLGLTCDPVGGLVQIPCIERNAMGAVKAIDASRLALLGDGQHMVSLDKVIETMRQTGADMRDKYKETSQGGLAVNVVEC
ncbi:MAG TPA: L-serine ammonia-lyase [Novosphingobium capsulatum]|nr:L-serine ammonia-lyase [Novosphingobium capsulatum]